MRGARGRVLVTIAVDVPVHAVAQHDPFVGVEQRESLGDVLDRVHQVGFRRFGGFPCPAQRRLGLLSLLDLPGQAAVPQNDEDDDDGARASYLKGKHYIDA